MSLFEQFKYDTPPPPAGKPKLIATPPPTSNMKIHVTP